MSVSLRELYNNLDSANEIVLVAGQQGLDHPVRWVHMVEGVDITLFLEGDEVAFTTGIALDGQGDLISLVRCTYERGAAGMVINVGPYIAKIPQEVIDFGNEVGFLIFRVPWRVHMANIMREFAMQITRQETVEMEIETAFDNAISQPENTKLYLPAILKHGYQKEWAYCVALVEMESEATQKQVQKYLTYAQRDFYTRDKYIAAYQKDNCFDLIFVNTSELQIKEQISAYLTNLRKYFDSKIHVCVGIGDKSADLEDLSTSYAEAKYALQLGKSMESGSGTPQKSLDSKNYPFLQKKIGDSKNEIIVFRELGVCRLLFATDIAMQRRNTIRKYSDRLQRTTAQMARTICIFFGCISQMTAVYRRRRRASTCIGILWHTV